MLISTDFSPASLGYAPFKEERYKIRKGKDDELWYVDITSYHVKMWYQLEIPPQFYDKFSICDIQFDINKRNWYDICSPMESNIISIYSITPGYKYNNINVKFNFDQYVYISDMQYFIKLLQNKIRNVTNYPFKFVSLFKNSCNMILEPDETLLKLVLKYQ
jgi:hypothetical protein